MIHQVRRNRERRSEIVAGIQVRIIQPPKGGANGLTFDVFRLGQTYDLPAALASHLVAEGFAQIEMRRRERSLRPRQNDRRRLRTSAAKNKTLICGEQRNGSGEERPCSSGDLTVCEPPPSTARNCLPSGKAAAGRGRKDFPARDPSNTVERP